MEKKKKKGENVADAKFLNINIFFFQKLKLIERPKVATETKVKESRKVELIFETPTHTRATVNERERERENL